MGIFNRKSNGDHFIKIIETITETSANMKNLKEGFVDHLQAGRIQRDEDKKRREEDKNWQTLLLDNSLKCSGEKRIVNLETEVKDLRENKTLNKGKFLGMKRIWIIVIGVGAVVMLVLNVIWKLWKMGLL